MFLVISTTPYPDVIVGVAPAQNQAVKHKRSGPCRAGALAIIALVILKPIF
jgi:hypothetical protein